MTLNKDPCETCLVRACCGILEKIMWYRCGCDDYEIYKTWQSLIIYCDYNEYVAQLMADNHPRMKELNFKIKKSEKVEAPWRKLKNK